MKCPHCRVEFYSEPSIDRAGFDADGGTFIAVNTCPNDECNRQFVYLVKGDSYDMACRRGYQGKSLYFSELSKVHPFTEESTLTLLYPRKGSRASAPVEVPTEYAEDYNEASLILNDSPKASAALSRRCLQMILVNKGEFQGRDLVHQINAAIESGRLPSHITEGLHAVRSIGNFAAHPSKSVHTGEIVSVEPGEAEWSLDVLESLFDFYFVEPARMEQRKDALNQKLRAMGKPEL